MSLAEETPLISIEHLDNLWFQVAGTRCNLTCNHCFISCSPHNHSFGFLRLNQVKQRLEESVSLGVKEFYFTGGEPFLNPELTQILVETLRYGPATVLTNATVLKDQWLEQLRQAERESIYSLEFRVSIDGFTREVNDPIRGEGTFDRALQGVEKLASFGFLPIITATRTWPEEDDLEVILGFQQLLSNAGCAKARIKLLPSLKIGAEANRSGGYQITERIDHRMMEDFDETQLICHNSRIVTDRGVHICPILIESPDSKLGESLSESLIDYPLGHGACYTCYQYGAICSNPSSNPFVKNGPKTAAKNGVN